MNNRNMSYLIAQEKSVGQTVIRQIQDFIRLRKAVYCLYSKSDASKIKFSDTCNIVSLRHLEQPHQNEPYEQSQPIKNLIAALNSYTTEFKYYQRSISKEHYQRIVHNLMINVQLICKNPKHIFYSTRKLQVQTIRDIVTILNLILMKLTQYLKIVKIDNISFILSDIEKAIQISQKIKFQHLTKNQHTKFNIKLNFPSPKYEIAAQKSKENLNTLQSETYKKSHVLVTNATTRPSSAYKQSLEASKIKKRWNNSTHPISFYDNSPPQLCLDKPIIQEKPIKNIIRCQTARVRNSKQKHTNLRKNQKQLEEERKSSKSGESQTKNYDKNKQVSNLEQTKKHIGSEGQKNSSISQGRVTTMSSKSTAKCFLSQQIKPHKKKHRKGAIKMSGTTQQFGNLKFINKQIEQLQKNIQKNQKLSQNLGIDVVKQHPLMRKYQSHQNLVAQQHSKFHKKFRNNQTYKRKNNMAKNRNMTKITEMAEPVQQINIGQHKHPTILLIKAPVESQGHHKNQHGYFLSRPTSTEQKDLIKRYHREKEGGLGQIHRQTDDNAQISNNDQKSNIQNTVNINSLKVNMEQINAIRSQFMNARWQNRIIGAQDKENSIFFIQQGFLSHRQNMKFQRYLKQLKQTNGLNEKKEPFPIQTQIEELNNQKLIQLERCFTFQGETEWIKNHFNQNSKRNQFQQKGLQSIETNCL